MNGETNQHLAQLKHSAANEGVSEDDDVPLAQRKQKPVGNEGPDRKKIKLTPSHDGERSLHSPSKQVKLNDSMNWSPHKVHVNSEVKQDHNRSPGMKSLQDVKKEIPSPAKHVHAASSHAAARTQHKVKTELKSPSSKPVKSALNSAVDEKGKPEKHDKAKNGKLIKPEKKLDKKLDVVKKHDSPKKAKKSESGKASKKPVESDDDEPLSARLDKTPTNKKRAKSSGSSSAKRKRKKSASYDDSDSGEDSKPLAKSAKKSATKSAKKEDKGGSVKKKAKKEGKDLKSEKEEKGKKKKEEEKEVWKWWEEEQLPEGVKWLHMEHKGPYFPPAYEPLPASVKFYYDGDHMQLSVQAEEVASYYARMLDHDYTSKEIFNKNFFEDWRKEMTSEERKVIKDLKKCDFKEMHAHFVKKAEERKNWTKEQKLELKKENEEILNEYGYCLMDGHKQRVGNFKIEPPGLFRGRGDHPKQGKFKKRTMPEDVIINIGEGAKVPEAPEGHKWQKVIHDNKVSWLACWVENIQGSYKYVMLNPTSRLKGEKDWQKYETARKLKDCVKRIREDYERDWKSKEMRLRQRGVALYFIDKLALRAGHEKDEETADTVGCCSLRVEHIKLHEEWEDKENVVEFDFLGKDSVRYWNFVPVEKKVTFL
ncbi:DNA topoisomerase 1-like isoform X2 [Orbicella faveolata]|uniref:DNA topoisomerase 1-like isoform X2 n=1 Tax=Orbicella faveolata TaxID=48498 RepID=UPI0009E3C14C|nr:DNA topoisomerase 1-like isoform X2 [Orbicella faveolata]